MGAISGKSTLRHGRCQYLRDARGGQAVRADERGLKDSQIKWQRLDSNQRPRAYEFQIRITGNIHHEHKGGSIATSPLSVRIYSVGLV